jgi:hypothetical protein
MNKKRIQFKQPNNHTINITSYWLLGFIEGEGYFSIARNQTFSLTFGIGQTLTEKEVLVKIKEFLFNLPGKYAISRKDTNVIQLSVNSKAKIESSNIMAKIEVKKLDYITNVLIPFFDKLLWFSKKKEDYLDWKIVLNLKNQGKHFLDKEKEIICLISNRMNQNRLSTNTINNDLLFNKTEITVENNSLTSLTVENNSLTSLTVAGVGQGYPAQTSRVPRTGVPLLYRGGVGYPTPPEPDIKSSLFNLDNEINLLLNAPSNFEIQSDGKVLIKSSGIILKGRGNIKIEMLNSEGILINTFDSVNDCATFFGLSSRTIGRRLDSAEPLKYNNQSFFIKRATLQLLYGEVDNETLK